MKMVETRIHDAVLTAIENLVIPRAELAMKSVNAFSGRSVDGVVLDLDQKDFSENCRKPSNDRFKKNKLAYRLK